MKREVEIHSDPLTAAVAGMGITIHSDPLTAAVALKNVLEGLKEVELGRPLQEIPFYTGEMDEHGNYVASFAPWGIWSVKHESFEGTIEILLTRSEQGQPITMLTGCFKEGHQSAFLKIVKSVRERCKSHSIYWKRNP
jgi:hypothetical protein